MLRAPFILCITWISTHVSGERPKYSKYEDITENGRSLRTFRGSNSFSSKTSALRQTVQGGLSFLTDGGACNEENDAMEEVFRNLGLGRPPGSYCSWPGVRCDECHVTELRLEQPQDVSGQLSPELSRLHRLKSLDFGGAVALTGRIEALRNATLLESLNLSHSQVEGDLEIFENHPKLQLLDLENVRVKGSIKVFGHTKNITLLKVNATFVQGDIAVFKKTPRLQELCLENAWNVKGNIYFENFAAVRSLRKLVITNSKVAGFLFDSSFFKELQEVSLERLPGFEVSLSAFERSTKLGKLIMKDVAVVGSIEPLPTSLAELNIGPLIPKEVEGNIRVFSDFRDLEVLSLEKTNVSGDLRSLSDLRLRVLNLACSNVEGNTHDLQTSGTRFLNLAHVRRLSGTIDILNGTLTHIHVMNLEGTSVDGDLQVLEEAKGLKELHVASTRIVGDITVLKHATELRVINITETAISGDIKVFQPMRELREVLAWQTLLRGNINVFINATNLMMLGLGLTSVHGDITALREATRLEVVGFTRTKVWGDIRVFEQAKGLREVWLSRTRIFGDIMVFYNFKQLQKVILSKTFVSGRIQAFKASRQIVQLALGDTKVEGDVEVFQRNRLLDLLTLDHTHVNGSFRTFDKIKHLKTLGLEGCNITGSLHQAAARLRRLRILRLSKTLVTGKLSYLASLRRLQEFYAATTAITGDIKGLLWMANIRVVDLSRTAISGHITSKWVGKVQKLRSLDVSESRATLLPSELEMARIETRGDKKLLPALEILQVSGCPLNREVMDLFRILVDSTLTFKISANGCNLTGTLADPSSFRQVDAFGTTVMDSLLSLDISNNSIEHVEGFPRRAKIMLSYNSCPLNFSDGVLAEAIDNKLELDLRGSRLASSDEMRELLMLGKLKLTADLSVRNETEGYGCFGLDPASTNLLGFGVDLLPDRMCGCLPGFSGRATNCISCGNFSYNADFNQAACRSCPPQMFTDEKNAKYETACKCSVGRQRVGNVCGCTAQQARGYGDVCIPCGELHLDCSEHGIEATDAPAVDGYARLEAGANHSFQCFPPADRCHHSGRADQNCAEGYHGILCMDCKRDYFATSGGCWPCKDSREAMTWRLGFAAVGIALVAIAGIAGAFIWYRTAPGAPMGFEGGFLMDIKQTAPILLQTCQLWAVLSALSVSQGKDHGEKFRSLAEWKAKLPELPVIEGLSFSLIDLQGILDFQCMMDAANVRYWKAILAPMLPLILLTLCGFFELQKRGSGISKGLLVLSIFFVGGASSCAKLASCQSYDAGGRPLGDFAFQELMPSLKCSERLPEVHGVFVVTFFCYLVPIPVFLLYLFAKQHLVLQPTKLLVSFSKEKTSEGKELHFARIPSDSDNQLAELKDEMLERRMVAGAVAYAAVFLGDHVQINLKDATAIVHGTDGERRSSDLLGSETLESFSSDVAELKNHSDALRCRAIAELLMERCVLFERCELAPSNDRDRVLAGARDMLMKYAACQNVWMEVALKLVTMSLVSVVRSHDGLQLSLAVTLVMATLVALLRPYARAQVNNIHCCCFISLAIAALSFSLRVPALSRAALVLPFLVAFGQVWLPESPEGRASRIWQELEPKLLNLQSAGGAGITASTKTLSITVRRSTQGN